eukprot:gene15080-44910_t
MDDAAAAAAAGLPVVRFAWAGMEPPYVGMPGINPSVAAVVPVFRRHPRGPLPARCRA